MCRCLPVSEAPVFGTADTFSSHQCEFLATHPINNSPKDSEQSLTDVIANQAHQGSQRKATHEHSRIPKLYQRTLSKHVMQCVWDADLDIHFCVVLKCSHHHVVFSLGTGLLKKTQIQELVYHQIGFLQFAEFKTTRSIDGLVDRSRGRATGRIVDIDEVH